MKGQRRTLRMRLRERRYTPATIRVGLACAVAAGVGLVELGSSSGADTSFVPGDALARAQAISLAPTTGGLNYAITLATSVSNYQDMQAQSLSQTIDLGAIGTSLEAQGCDGSAPTLPKSDVPPPVQAESTDGNQSLSEQRHAPVLAGRPRHRQRGGHRHHATVVGLADDGVEHLGAGRVAGGQRADVEREGLHRQRGHPDRHVHGGRRADLARQRCRRPGRPALVGHPAVRRDDDLRRDVLHRLTQRGRRARRPLRARAAAGNPQTVLNVINTALTPVGLNVQWPTQSTLSDGTVQISPLVVGIDNNALGQQVVGANENSVQPVREALVNALLSANCNFATELTVGDIGLGVLSGGGNLNLEFGGASAETDNLAASSPFGTGGGGTALPRRPRRPGAAAPATAAAASAASALPVTSNSGVGPFARRRRPAPARPPGRAPPDRQSAGVARSDHAHVGLHQPRPVRRGLHDRQRRRAHRAGRARAGGDALHAGTPCANGAGCS